MTIGEKIKKRRIELGMSVDMLADKIGKSRATVYRYENGGIMDLPSSVLVPVAQALGTTPAQLICDADTAEGLHPEMQMKKELSEKESPELSELNEIMLSLPKEAVDKLLDYARLLKSFYE